LYFDEHQQKEEKANKQSQHRHTLHVRYLIANIGRRSFPKPSDSGKAKTGDFNLALSGTWRSRFRRDFGKASRGRMT
jgi:hypothetical protein